MGDYPHLIFHFQFQSLHLQINKAYHTSFPIRATFIPIFLSFMIMISHRTSQSLKDGRFKVVAVGLVRKEEYRRQETDLEEI